jgi:anti-anti-sigma factor
MVLNKKRRYVEPDSENTNQMTTVGEYHYQDSDSYSLEISEKEIKVIRSDKKISILFTLRPYLLNGKDFVFMQVNDFGEGVDLERMVIPLDNIFSALEANKLFHIIFSFKGVWYFSDIALSISISHMQRIEDNGGQIIFCNVDRKIIDVMEILELDKIAKWYTSEAEMLEMKKA